MKNTFLLFILFIHYQFIFAQQKCNQLPIIFKFNQKIVFGFNEKHCGGFINKGGAYNSASQIQPSIRQDKIHFNCRICCGSQCTNYLRKKRYIFADTAIIEKTELIVPPNSFVFPNPAFDYVQLDIPYMATKMYILNTNGSILRTYDLQKSMQRKFFIGDLATGMYIFCIFGREKPEILKVVKTPI